jgi:acylphosphatase
MNSEDPSAASADLHLTVLGRVQGVGFRESLVRVAQELGLHGWVRNRSDGSVEAVVRGAVAQRERLVQWARRGPPAAQVEQVRARPASAEESALVGGRFVRRETHLGQEDPRRREGN